MKAREILRTAVVKTNPYWPFSSLNRMPYYFAIRGFIRLCQKFPEIKSTYLRHGLTEGNWVPALSDIDLTLITDSKVTMDEEFSFLSSFWSAYDRLKRLFPMLGDVEILNDELIETWTKFNIRGYESRNWTLIYGTETRKNNYAVNATRLRIDSLHNALRIYFQHILKRFYAEESHSFLISEEMRRVGLKALRYANYLHGYPDKEGFRVSLGNEMHILSLVLTGLEKNIRQLLVEYGSPFMIGNHKEGMGDIDSPSRVAADDQALDIAALAPWHEAIASIILSQSSRTYIILRDGLDASAMRDCLEAVRRVFIQKDSTPVMMSSSVFKYLIRYYRPFEYTNFIKKRSLAYGKDLLPEIHPPDEYFLINFLMAQIPNLLTFPQRHTLISPLSRNDFWGQDLDSKAERSLLLKLYLEKGVIKPCYDELLHECKLHYLDDFRRFHELKTMTSSLKDEALSREAYTLFKYITGEIHTYVSNSNVLDTLFQKVERIQNRG